MQCQFGFAYDHQGRATLARSNAEACRQTKRFAKRRNWFGEDIHAQALGEQVCVDCAAARQNQLEFVIAASSECVITSQQTDALLNDCTQQATASSRSQGG